MSSVASLSPQSASDLSMSKLVRVLEDGSKSAIERGGRLCSALESGSILFLPETHSPSFHRTGNFSSA
jgi:hypothetical protein